MNDTIAYTAVVVSQDEDAKVMLVTYSADDYPNVTVGVPMPSKGATEDEKRTLIHSYAPIQHWRDSVRQVEPVTSGFQVEGVATFSPMTIPTSPVLVPPEFVPPQV